MTDHVKLFVGNLPLDATQDELNKLFAPYGEINTCSLCRHYAFVTLRGEGASDRAIRHLNGKEYRGRPLVVEESRARPPNSIKVFVGNVSATCSADDLHGLFSTFGRVLDCDKVKARLCSNVGYAFVHMERKEEALAAIDALNGTMFKGRPLAVELSKAQPLINQLASGGSGSPAGMADQEVFKHSSKRGAAKFQSLKSDCESSACLHQPEGHLAGDAAVYGSPEGERGDADIAENDNAQEDLLFEGDDIPQRETSSILDLRDEADVLLEYEYEDFDGDAAVPSLREMSPPESIRSDEELSVDQIKDLNNPDERVETEGAVLAA